MILDDRNTRVGNERVDAGIGNMNGGAGEVSLKNEYLNVMK